MTGRRLGRTKATLSRAWADLPGIPHSLLAGHQLATAVSIGWTPAHVQRLAALAEHARRHETGIYRWYIDTGRDDTRFPGEIASVISEMLFAHEGFTADQMLAWLTMAVSAETPGEDLGILARLKDDDPLMARRDPEDDAPTVMYAWEHEVPGGLAPWAYAAGLSREEAAGMCAAGALTRDGLLVLAGLQGWRFPDLSKPTSTTDLKTWTVQTSL